MNDLAPVLDEVVRFVRRFVFMTPAQAHTVALWTFHTWTIEASDYTGYLFVTSAERESGKSRLKEVLELLVARPVSTANVSTAALFRIAGDKPPPTFLIDEVDAIFAPKSDRNELRGLLNAGFRRGEYAIRMVGEGAKMEPKRFEVFCPKLLAGKRSADIGDTLASRCIFIELKRKTREEHVDRLRRREVEDAADALAEGLRSLADLHVDALAFARPHLLDELSDRQLDVWEPLLGLAELAGEQWAERARLAALELSGSVLQGDSVAVLLLAHVRDAFGTADRISSKDLIAALTEDEEAPWGTWHKGKPISPRALAGLLEPFGVRSRTVRFEDDSTAKGYMRSSFEDAWTRYAPATPDLSDTTSQARNDAGSGPFPSRHAPELVTDENALNPALPNGCDVVTAETTPNGRRKLSEDDEDEIERLAQLSLEAQADARGELH